jgi:hypothetical protein
MYSDLQVSVVVIVRVNSVSPTRLCLGFDMRLVVVEVKGE